MTNLATNLLILISVCRDRIWCILVNARQSCATTIFAADAMQSSFALLLIKLYLKFKVHIVHQYATCCSAHSSAHVICVCRHVKASMSALKSSLHFSHTICLGLQDIPTFFWSMAFDLSTKNWLFSALHNQSSNHILYSSFGVPVVLSHIYFFLMCACVCTL